jgi:mannose-6-phosphate isomerase-like protein (cupin superfamily)
MDEPAEPINRYTAGETDTRPWGRWELLGAWPGYAVKRIVVEPRHRLSLQKHRHRAEQWTIVQGSALVTRDDERIALVAGESIALPLGCVHRVENPGDVPLVFIEVQMGRYLAEDDIIRLEDQYGRN